MLAATRTRRPNAGNRMQALLAAQDALQEEEVFEEVAGDVEFEAAPDEADIFGSDFESTDSEPDDAPPLTQTDASLLREELASRSKTRKFHDPLASRRPTPGARVTSDRPRAKRRRPSEADDLTFQQSLVLPRREVRSTTIIQKIETNTRLKTARALKRPPVPKKTQVALTQSDRIEMALELEGTNKRELEDWLEKEEERRRSVLVRRGGVKGERVMWISRTVGRSEADSATPVRYERNLLNLFDVAHDSELSVILGNHANWNALPIINASPATPSQPTKCPITGLPARYKCPRTGIPYANLTAYRTIQKLVPADDAKAPEYRWSAQRNTWLGGVGVADGSTMRPVGAEEGLVGDVGGWREAMMSR